VGAGARAIGYILRVRQRLLLGPFLIAFLVFGFWADERLDAAALPEWLHGVFGGATTLPPGVLVFIVCAGLCVIASRELSAILREKGVLASKRVMTASAGMGLLVSCLVPNSVPGVHVVALVSTAGALVLSFSLLFYARHKTVEGVVAAAGGSLLAFVYLGLMFGFILAIRREHSGWVLMWVLLTTKASDIGAYFTGRSIGRRKLIPWLSPGKTWEGLCGGAVLAAVVGCVGIWALKRADVAIEAPVWSGLVAGVLFGLLGQLGDLMASLLKRDAGIKDSGRVLPGFGGLLDVLDSPLLVAPLAFWWLWAWHTPVT
jgi:phosphatidate cytidylyltransferase